MVVLCCALLAVRLAAEHICEGVGTLLSSIIPEWKEATKEDGIG
jgi:hypothetical protein